MSGLLQQRVGAYLVLLGSGEVLFLVNLGGPSLWDVDEGRNATAALEMLESGNWVVPTFNGEFRCHKPIVTGYRPQPTAPSASTSSPPGCRRRWRPADVAARVRLGRRLFDHATGLLGGLVLASCPQFLVAGHFANPDALLTCCRADAVLFRRLRLALPAKPQTAAQQGCGWFILLGVAVGLAVLAKGPVGLVVPAWR